MKAKDSQAGQEDNWPASKEDSDSFMRAVIERLAPDHRKSIEPLPQDFFWDLTRSVYEQIAATPALKKKLLEYTPAPLPRTVTEVRQTLDEWAAQDRTGTFRRALSKGLAERLTETLNEERIAECRAWRIAMQCRVCDMFSQSQRLSGFQEAVDSVDKALRKHAQKHPRNWDVWLKRMWHGTSLRSALLEYWLPLGLWAMSVNDAIRSLTLFSQDAIIGRLNQKERLEIAREHPGRKEFMEKGKLKCLSAKKDTGAFKTAVCHFDLFRPPTPLAKLALRPQKAGGPLLDQSDGSNRLKDAPSIAQATKRHREDPSQWDFVTAEGEPLESYW